MWQTVNRGELRCFSPLLGRGHVASGRLARFKLPHDAWHLPQVGDFEVLWPPFDGSEQKVDRVDYEAVIVSESYLDARNRGEEWTKHDMNKTLFIYRRKGIEVPGAKYEVFLPSKEAGAKRALRKGLKKLVRA